MAILPKSFSIRNSQTLLKTLAVLRGFGDLHKIIYFGIPYLSFYFDLIQFGFPDGSCSNSKLIFTHLKLSL